MVKVVKTSSWYLQKWKEMEEKIAEEIEFLAVKKAENGEDQIEFYEDRISKLKDMAEYYKSKYEEAYLEEKNTKKTRRLKTYNNGL
jgi:ABC-type Fe3+-hydroxamate transport system substrate-binding protein